MPNCLRTLCVIQIYRYISGGISAFSTLLLLRIKFIHKMPGGESLKGTTHIFKVVLKRKAGKRRQVMHFTRQCGFLLSLFWGFNLASVKLILNILSRQATD